MVSAILITLFYRLVSFFVLVTRTKVENKKRQIQSTKLHQ